MEELVSRELLESAGRILNVECRTMQDVAEAVMAAPDPKELLDTLRLILLHDHGEDPFAGLFLDANGTKAGRARQEEFRRLVIARDGVCVLSGYHPDECEAAHIVPFCESLSFDPDNGILLNRVLHKLFDDRVFSIDPDNAVVVARPDAAKYKSLAGIVGTPLANLSNPVKRNLAHHHAAFLQELTDR